MVFIHYAGVEYELRWAKSAKQAKTKIGMGLVEGDGQLWIDAYQPDAPTMRSYVELFITPGIPIVILEAGI